MSSTQPRPTCSTWSGANIETVGEAYAARELLEDRGEAAASEEFFRSRPFLEAEGVTHTLRIEAGEAELLAPLVVRPITDADARDAVSPYGYPGVCLLTAVGVDPL